MQKSNNLEEQAAAGARQARAAAGGADVLAGEAGGPEIEVVGDAGEAAGEAEPADAGEQVDLPAAGDFVRPDEPHVASVNDSGRQSAIVDPRLQDLAAVRVDFVVQGHGHRLLLSHTPVLPFTLSPTARTAGGIRRRGVRPVRSDWHS
jgi:hypothetical protein